MIGVWKVNAAFRLAQRLDEASVSPARSPKRSRVTFQRLIPELDSGAILREEKILMIPGVLGDSLGRKGRLSSRSLSTPKEPSRAQ